MPQAFQALSETVAAWAQQAPERIALLGEGRDPLTYRRLVEQARRLSHALDAKGVTPAQRIAVCINDRPSMALCLVGLLFHGAPIIPLDPTSSANDVKSYLKALRAEVLVCGVGENLAAQAAGDELGLTVIELEKNEDEIGFRFDDDDLPSAHPNETHAPSDIALFLATSGTTGSKIVPRTQEELAANVGRLTKWLGLGPQDCCLNVMPLYLAHGIYEGVLAALYTGGSTIITSRSDTDSFYACLEAYQPTWYTAVYTFHRGVISQAAAHEDAIRRASLTFIRNGGMHFPPRDIEKIEALFNAPLIDTYGMTETGCIACAPLPPRDRKVGTVGLQVIEEIKMIDETGVEVAKGQTGEVVVRSPGVMKKYVDNPTADAEAFVDGWFRTGDLGFFDDEGYLTLVGRTKEMINRGAEKISPTDIERELARHPNVEDIVVFGVPHITLGQDVAAAIIFKDDQGVSSSENLRSFAFSRLKHSKVPRQLFPVTSIPRGPGGKPQRNILAEKLAAPGKRSETGAADIDLQASPTTIALLALWQSLLKTSDIGLDDDFFALGGDSLSAVQLIMSVQEDFNVELPLEIVSQDTNTVRRMAAAIDDVQSGPPDQTTRALPSATIDRPTNRIERKRPVIDAADLRNTIIFIVLFAIAGLLPTRWWAPACRFIAGLHLTIRGSQPAHLKRAITALELAMGTREFERQSLADTYEEIVYSFRDRLPGGWQPKLRLHGLEHLNAALEGGQGAVLWTVPVTRGELSLKRALQDAGHSSVFLRSDIHPYSGTIFGRRFLNPLRTRVEDRYMQDHVSLVDGEETQAVYELVDHLNNNAVVGVAGIHGGKRPLQVPFLGGTLNLALGAPSLASICGAPLLSVWVVTSAEDEFDIWIKPPLQSSDDNKGLSAETMALEYVEILRSFLAEHPTAWRGWSTPGQWSVN